MRTWLRPLPFALLLAYVASRAGRAPVDDAAASRSAALCDALAHDGVTCVPEDVTWIDPPRGAVRTATGATTRAIVRGRAREKRDDQGEPGAPPLEETFDLFLTRVRLSPEARLLDVGEPVDVTHTSGADEGVPIVKGSLVAYVVSVDGHPEAVHVLDLAGHDRRALDDLSRAQRTQVSIADWQATGQWRGIKRTVYVLTPPPRTATLSFRADGTLDVKAEAAASGQDAEPEAIAIDPVKGAVLAGEAHVRVIPEVVAKPPTFAAWTSDRLRAISWFGDEKNQVLKAVVFTALEWLKGTKSKLSGDTGEQDAQEDIQALKGKLEPPTFTDPEIGWPPRPLEPMMKPPLRGEGQWVALESDPFITPIPGVASPFVTTFVRTDPAAQQTRVYVTLWDPRLVALHMVAGTVEPVSATGEAGPGVIPRTPEVMEHVVAGFNGGFQATHGEFGMQADGVLYLPPKPYAATVLELRDGTTAFGAWPKSAEVPDEVLSFRQNMTALVENDKYNPWGRTWWGGVPPGWHDAVHTTRSGLCMTKEGYVGYFWGNDMGPEPLGRAMLLARCAFGIHLDMNPGLAGFEFYNVQPAATFQPLGRPLQPDWEYEGTLKDMPDVKFRSRRMIKSMGHMLFPRYVHRDARDFFYLTTRTVLPGAPIGDEPWRVKGLPQHGYPYAIALASPALEGGRRVRVVRIDPRTVRADANATTDVVALFGRATPAHHHRDAGADLAGGAGGAASAGGKKLWLGAHVFTIDTKPPPSGVPIADLSPGGVARAAVGVSDEDGMLQWVELAPGDDKTDAQTSDAMLKLLARLGCSARALVAGDVRAFVGGSLDASGQPVVAPTTGMHLVRTPAPGAKPYFESTTVVPASVWSPLQQQRVKWRPTLAPPTKPSASASTAPPPSGAPSPAPPR
jgi:hypothetical protein